MARRKVIITVAQTGAFHGKEANPNIPLTPEEITASAYDCYNAGAAIIHIHARDQEGLSTNDPKVYSAIGSGIRARCNAILQYSTAPANREGTCAEDGMRLLYDPDLVKPEMCSLDCSLIGTSWGDRTFVYEWYRPFLLKYARSWSASTPRAWRTCSMYWYQPACWRSPSHSPLSWVWTASARAPSPSPRRTWTS